ncbi:MAG: tyrosine-type recombinase/integrase [Firmicutes bacterium]|nr:tyrosine-type recombinase/integrase [Bacillota bacterium]
MKNEIRMPEFDKGVFTKLILEFIYYKRSCGLKYVDSAEYVLRAINRELNNYGVKEPALTKEMVENLVKKRPHEQYSTQSRRISLLRQLALYLSWRGIDAYIYPELSIHKEEKTFVPYLFTDSEMNSVFSLADHLPPISRYPFYHMIYPVLIRLLYSCGLRLSEALNLRIKDIDMESATLYIDKSKKSKSRVVAMSASMNKVLSKYISNRYGNTVCSERYVFEAPDGGRYNRGNARATIMNIFKHAGLPQLTSGRHPRVQDLRHNFSVKAMEKMKESGMDLYCTLPLLSAYLGHKGIRETERYLWLPQFRMDEIASSGSKLVEGMIPEVEWNDED